MFLRAHRALADLTAAVLGAALVLGAATPAARAQDAEPDAAPADAYERAFVHGRQLFDAGEFGAARVEFLRAYAAKREPLLLFNIGSTYRREGDVAKALEYYERFLAEAPPEDPLRATAEELVVELRAQIQEEARRAEAEREPPPPPPPPPVEPLAPTAGVATDVPPPRPGRTLRIAGIVTAAAGALCVGIAFQQGAHAADLESDLQAMPDGTPWTPETQQLYDDGQNAERNSIIFGITGGVALAAGAGLYFLGRSRANDSSDLALAPYASATTTGLALAGRF